MASSTLKMKYINDLTMIGILKCIIILFTGSAVVGDMCVEDIDIVTSRCLANYENKVDHMKRNQHNFYTGVDMEEMRSLCSAMSHAIKCIANEQNNCPELKQQLPSYPSDLIAMYHLCHTPNFYEQYAMNQFCYSAERSSTERCHQRFDTNTRGYTHRVAQGNSAAVQQYCEAFDEMVQCVWALVTNMCGEGAGELVEALVRPAIEHSDMCMQEQQPATTLPSPTTTTQVLYQYKDDHGHKKNVQNPQQQDHNDELLENSAISLQFRNCCVQLLLSAITLLLLLLLHHH